MQQTGRDKNREKGVDEKQRERKEGEAEGR